MIRLWIVAALALMLGSSAQAVPAASKHRHVSASPNVADNRDGRPLTIDGRRGRGIVRRGNDIIAPGGFAAHGYGYPAASPDERREAFNARIRASASGPYVYGADGLAIGGDRDAGSSNPFWGNGFSSYVGYNGVPTDLAFGPGFANRHLADHDPDDDDEPGPTPSDLGYEIP